MKCVFAALALFIGCTAGARWGTREANSWYARQPWPVGANYIPASAVNQLEMWQAETFDPARIDFELAHAEAIGMNTLRVFLHDLVWQQDPQGFTARLDLFWRLRSATTCDRCWYSSIRVGMRTLV